MKSMNLSGAIQNVYELRIDPFTFNQLVSGCTSYLFQPRSYNSHTGDTLLLKEYDAIRKEYTGNTVEYCIVNITKNNMALREDYVLLNVSRRVTPSIVRDVPALLLKTANIVRRWMTSHYGEGVNLAGHCIEASELIVSILDILGVNAETVEGWVRYDDTRYCEYPYDAHTWVEVVNDDQWYYIDVTADQFNYGMNPEFQFSGVIIQTEYPHGVSQELLGDEGSS